MTTLLIRNAQVFAPAPLGLCNLLLGGGRILWIGTEAIDLPSALGAATLERHELAAISTGGRRGRACQGCAARS